MPRKKQWIFISIASLLAVFLVVVITEPGFADSSSDDSDNDSGVSPAPDREEGEGEGPYDTLVIQGATMIDGTGAPPEGPVDILIEGNEIQEVGTVEDIPEDAEVIDADGMYVMPGFVDTHFHIGGEAQGVDAEYVHKLQMAHGVTTIRDPGSSNGVSWTLNERERSANNEIVAPRIYSYIFPGDGDWDGEIESPEDAREYVQWAAEEGADGFKLRRWDPPIMEALIDEAQNQNLGTITHLEQTVVAPDYLPNMASWGLGSLDHWYGLPEALFDDRTVQDFPADYNYSNEYDRFSVAGELWEQAAEPGSDTWNEVMDELLDHGLAMTPTFNIYEATRDYMRVQNEDWHESYTAPSLEEFFQPSLENHGSFFFDWTTGDEVAWKANFNLWMEFINEYKNRGGKVTVGSDAGFIYRTYGFSYIRELEMLQEAGFHPLEVIRSATMEGAELIAEENNEEMTFGMIRENMLADIILVEENPLNNLKTLYGPGAMQLNEEDGIVEYVGGVKYTIKDGIVYDAPQLLDDVEEMVRVERENTSQDENDE